MRTFTRPVVEERVSFTLNLAVVRILFMAQRDLIWVAQRLDTFGGFGLGQSLLESDAGITLVADGAEVLIERVLQLFGVVGVDLIFACGQIESACARTAMPTAGSCGGLLVLPGRMHFGPDDWQAGLFRSQRP